jgi:hypothetical protein
VNAIGSTAFEKFQSSRLDVPCLATALPSQDEIPESPGFVYDSGLWIERSGDEYVLTIGNVIDTSSELAELEFKLYTWASDEGHF